MKSRLFLYGLLTIPGAACAGGPPNMHDDQSALPRARDGNVAIAQELEAARRYGTIQAYDLFIARHPDHPLAEAARRDRQALARRRAVDREQ